MAKFIFSMQNLLDMKEKLEEQAKNNYSQANMRLMEAEEELRRLRDRVAEAQELKAQAIAGNIDDVELKRQFEKM